VHLRGGQANGGRGRCVIPRPPNPMRYAPLPSIPVKASSETRIVSVGRFSRPKALVALRWLARSSVRGTSAKLVHLRPLTVGPSEGKVRGTSVSCSLASAWTWLAG